MIKPTRQSMNINKRRPKPGVYAGGWSEGFSAWGLAVGLSLESMEGPGLSIRRGSRWVREKRGGLD